MNLHPSSSKFLCFEHQSGILRGLFAERVPGGVPDEPGH
jgi:hypothetical protein